MTSRSSGPLDVSEPVAGFYRMRLRSGGQPVGIRIWHGPPSDPVTGEQLDRSPRWQADANGRPIDFDRVWPMCGREPISQSYYLHLLQIQLWAERAAPGSALADPRRKPDPLTDPIPF